ncbi:MAG: hypothetical protein GF317_20950 [Candidatus Lokiarchaeota archaeon]|nr:hypothetical protein [Candidatus Lokiarchaeota archaeon]MBD3201914.1 hypothetical protein [Candidatus Lokiarchaeota archaeon]
MVKVAFMQGSDCWGCHQSLLNTHLGLLEVLPALEIVYWPAVVDFKHQSLKDREDGEILVGFCEGSMRTEEDIENVKLMRQKCQLIIAFGSCSCYGNVHGLANEWDIEEVKARKFKEVESITNDNPEVPSEHVPPFAANVAPTDRYIKIDAYMSGCPPKPEQIVSAVQFLLGQKAFPMEDTPFCNECPLNESGCVLDAGTLCFGPITSVGCSLKCPGNGDPCVGCFGPAKSAHERVSKLIEKTQNIGSLSSGEKKSLFEFLSLYLNVPLMAGFDLSGDILRQISEGNEVETPLANLSDQARQVATNVLGYLKENRDFHEGSTVCDTCPRIIGEKQPDRIRRDYEGLPNMDDCLINQGYICMGPVTRAGCGGLCMRVNAPCSGCYGQSAWNVDQAERYAETVVEKFNTGLTKEQILSQVKDPVGAFEKFTYGARDKFKGGA